MLIEPTDPTSSTATRTYLASVKVKAPALAEWSDDDLLALAREIATRAYRGDGPGVWTYGDSLGLPRFDYGIAVYETLHGLYPVAAVLVDEEPR